MRIRKAVLYSLLFLFLFSLFVQPETTNRESLQAPQVPSSLLAIPSQGVSVENSSIQWPKIGNPAIVLNGSSVEIRVSGPTSISSWSISLYREYLEHDIDFETPLRNDSTGIWHINASIPTDSHNELFDLRISISDGVSSNELVERNAVQIRYSFPSDIVIFHITDTHISSIPTDLDTRLLLALYQASAARADLVIISGDLVDEGRIVAFERFSDLISQSSVPVFVIPGNHDVDPLGGGYTNYMTFFGDDHYTANVGPDIFLTMANTHSGALTSSQVEYIEREMAGSNAQTKILSLHHSLPNMYYLSEPETLELIRICNETNVDIVLTGHSHLDRVDEGNGTLWISTTAIGAQPQSVGHGRNGFRIIEFQDGTPTSWNWTVNQPWSQPWDSVMLTRHPMKYHDADVGAYLAITNNLNYSIDDTIFEFLVQPVTGDGYYIASGANVISTVNGTDAFLIRMGVDLDAGESTTIRIYPNDVEAPSLLSITYPESVLVEEEYVISVNLTIPSSGLMDVHMDVVFDGESLDRYSMASSDGIEWRTFLVHDTSGEIEFQIGASDYSGLEYSSPIYTIECVAPEQPLSTILFFLGGLGLVSVIVVVLLHPKRMRE
ncbi:MAG: metallophosphoesterase family protein [Candidatus Thorarchaeota archaeon]|jgi:3',5'-cyclic AMP phosphodiesterase CpdA